MHTCSVHHNIAAIKANEQHDRCVGYYLKKRPAEKRHNVHFTTRYYESYSVVIAMIGILHTYLVRRVPPELHDTVQHQRQIHRGTTMRLNDHGLRL